MKFNECFEKCIRYGEYKLDFLRISITYSKTVKMGFGREFGINVSSHNLVNLSNFPCRIVKFKVVHALYMCAN